MSPITVIRDRIAAEFETLKRTESGRVKEFDVSLFWLSETETKRASTYCVIVSGETRAPQTHANDVWELKGKIIVWAMDTSDAAAKLYDMIEDVHDVLRRAFRALEGTIQSAVVEEWDGPERTTSTKDWAQAVIPWVCKHRRAVMV